MKTDYLKGHCQSDPAHVPDPFEPPPTFWSRNGWWIAFLAIIVGGYGALWLLGMFL